MNHIRQIKNECYPTMLAMLSDKPVESVIKTLLDGTPFETWDQLLKSHAIQASSRARHFIQRNAMSLVPWITESAMISGRDTEPIDVPDAEIATGRGAITMRRRFGFGFVGHVVAFENGEVFDSSFPEKVSWNIWKFILDKTGGEIISLNKEPDAQTQKA